MGFITMELLLEVTSLLLLHHYYYTITILTSLLLLTPPLLEETMGGPPALAIVNPISLHLSCYLGNQRACLLDIR